MRRLITSFNGQLIHDRLDLTVARGEVLGIVGASGAGKSILLNALAGLKRPNAGAVRVLGVDIYSDLPHQLKALKARWGCYSRATRCSPT